MYLVDTNQPQTDSLIVINKSWKHPTATKQEIIREVGFEMAIYWYRSSGGRT